ncbi:MAG: response regulator transcription factor [Campylobacterota bacterium]|nr:response regulator transcription factor [Campylobacterota bacterium]
MLFSYTKTLTLLLVEDYEPLSSDMAEILEEFFETVIVASNGEEALKMYKEYAKLHQKYFDIVITDIQMPIMNGIELSELLYEINDNQQIIVLSAYTDSAYLLKLINLGIAQFITKPVKYDELIGTLYKVSKKLQLPKEENLKRDNKLIYLNETYIWNQEQGLLFQNNKIVDLSKYESQLLQYFIEKNNQICTSIDILGMFYLDNIDLQESSIRNLIFKLRKKLPENSIRTIYGVGYMFSSL